MTDSTRIWHGFSFNPGVRRTIDYRRLGTYSRHVRFDFDHPPSSEIGLNNVVRDLGLYAYLLADNFGYGYVRHTGHERHVGKQPLDPKTQAELDEAHAQVAELTREVELLRQSQAAASSRSAALEQQLAQARAQIDALYRSTSWKVTAPLRALRGGAPSGAPGA
jgi:hypothetical protein